MQWEDERYVRLYTRDTATWKLLPWQAKCLLPILMRKLDRRGVADVGDEGLAGVAALTDMPLELVEAAWPELVKRGVFTFNEGCVTMPNYVAAQEARASNAERQRKYREGRRENSAEKPHESNATVTARNAELHDVTKVTPSLAQPSLAQPSLASGEAAQQTLSVDPPAVVETARAIERDPDLGPICRNALALARDIVSTCPLLDAPSEVRLAGAWIRSSPSNRKQNGNKFLLGWCRREQDNPSGRRKPSPPPELAAPRPKIKPLGPLVPPSESP
jgi:hypothetical protein